VSSNNYLSSANTKVSLVKNTFATQMRLLEFQNKEIKAEFM